mmetsp:Transcript_81773/g.212747  ORF Transcript_81773/g.212747 Transcript_81773/m.212747 type:complete len:159 (+) Transcript_81773:64-540(+)
MASGAGEAKSAGSHLADDFNDDLKFLKGKYDWSGGENKPAESAVQRGTIDKYSWADGSKTVSIYIDVPDEVPDEEIQISHTAETVTLTVQGDRLHIPKLAHNISDARFTRKPGKNQLVVKLVKADVVGWSKLAGEVVNPNSGCYTQKDAKDRVTPSSA